MNSVKLSGRLTRDPDVRITSNGTQVATFTLAVDRNYGKGTDFPRCVAWDRDKFQTAQFVKDYVFKGMKIIVEGELRTRSYERDGKRQEVAEVNVDHIEFCESKNKPKDEAFEDLDEETPDDLPF
jgi:single-strand DNA-binding protein